MKNKITLRAFVFFFLLSSNLLAQNFWVPDSIFRVYLKSHNSSCFTAQDSMITSCNGIKNEQSMIINNRQITSIEGIQFFTSLKMLDCSKNLLTTLPPLPDSLTILYCQDNSLASITTLPNSIFAFSCYNNLLSSFPSLPSSLINFNCSNNLLTVLPPLSNSLGGIMCQNNLLTSLPPLPNSLTHLWCTNNLLTSLPPLPSSLEYFYCNRNLLTSIPSLPNTISQLVCDNNLLTSLPPLPDSVTVLDCSNNLLTSLPQLPNHLTFLVCDSNSLLSLPNLPQLLTFLYCNNNSLTSLPLLPDSLRVLRCYNNSLSGLPPLNRLTNLKCSFNSITSLPAMTNSLGWLECNNNLLKNLPPLPNSLIYLYCNNNSITNLPNLPSTLFDLNCSNNPISCLPLLSANLGYLNVNNTYVTCLPNLPLNISTALPLCSLSAQSCNYSYTHGFIFRDDNLNGIKDSVETGFHLPVSYSGNYSVFSDTKGFFTAVSDTGNITFQLNVPAYYSSTTSTSQSIHVTGNSIDTIYFGLQPIPNIKDLKVDVVLYNALRPGFKVNYKIHYQNVGTTSLSNTVLKFLKPSLLTNLSSTPISTFTSGDTLIWNIGNLNPYEEDYITIEDSVSVLATLGSVADADVWIEPASGDTTPQNNYKKCHEIISGSYDPNDKSVYPESVSPNSTDYIEYIIRFQNTGTDTAFSVFLTDTLSTDLDVATIEIISTSHQNSFWVEHGIAKWYFANILLPDSNVNEANSHGFVKFRIRQKANLLIGTQISNTANIYFDYNAAVVTNTIIVNVTPLSVPIIADEKLQIYPNPVHQTVHLNSNNGSALGKVELINSDGQLIETKYLSTSSFDWQVEKLPAGVYIFKGENWKEKIVKK